MNRLGAQTFVYPSKPSIRAAAAIVGPKEGQGPMRDWFDEVLTDDKLGMPTYEQAESELLRRTIA